MDQAEALAKVRAYAARVLTEFQPVQVLLYGSYARGDQKEESDLDVAVVVKSWPTSVLEAQTQLFRLTSGLETRIEPILLEEDHDRSGFLASIRKYAIVVSG